MAGTGLAQTPAADDRAAAAQDQVFASIDVDRSKTLSIMELKAADPSITQADLNRHDRNRSGTISYAEFEAWSSERSFAVRQDRSGVFLSNTSADFAARPQDGVILNQQASLR
jgi:hypothetical protein